MARESSSGAGLLIGIILGGIGLIVITPIATCFLCCGGMAFFGSQLEKEARQELADGNKFWDEGKKGEAVSKYKSVLDRNMSSVPGESEKPIIYQRIIEYDVEKGNTESAKILIEKALEKNVNVSSSNKTTNDLIAKVRADREKRLAESKPKTNDKPTANKDEHDRNGLVLLWSKTEGKITQNGAEITGEVVNRRGRKLGYVQVSFSLYDADDNLVGTALANVNGLESGSTWKFKAVYFGSGKWKTFKLDELSGF